MKKILFFICTLDDGGAQRVVSMLSSKMVERGFDVEVLKYYKSENIYPISDKVKITTLEEQTGTTNKLTNTMWMRKYFKNNADVIISFLATYNMLAICANKGNNIPIIVADRNDPRYVPSNKIIRTLRDDLYKHANGIVVQTSDNKNYFSKDVQDKCSVIMNPFVMKDKIGSALKANKEDLIVSVGRLEKQKNQEMLINAFAELNDKYPTYKLVIYGEGPNRDTLQELINSKSLQEKVLLPGSVDDVLDKIKSTKLFVLPSNYEGMSNALAEAMCVGLPVISTNVSGASDLITNNENGLIINIDNKQELINAIDKMLTDEEFSNKCANNATEISKKLDIDVICDEWLEFISKVKK
ncbi:MAG: glycosyltransferase [Erysipelotrichaceae bacterium]|nr:glycosyltransferase [Erysipelotrichaceae bacterium]